MRSNSIISPTFKAQTAIASYTQSGGNTSPSNR